MKFVYSGMNEMNLRGLLNQSGIARQQYQRQGVQAQAQVHAQMQAQALHAYQQGRYLILLYLLIHSAKSFQSHSNYFIKYLNH